MTRKCFLLVCFGMSFPVILQTGCQENGKLAQEASSTSRERVEFQQDAANTPELKTLSPKITFEKLVHDFGEVSLNSVHTGEIRFKNAGQAPLRITKVGKCCGLVAEVNKAKTEYAPGEGGTLKLRWRSGSQPAVFKRQVMVHSNDPSNPVTSVTIQAKAVPKVVWTPKRLRLSLDQENAGCPKVKISSLDNQPFSIIGFKATNSCMTADFDPSARATKHVIEPKVDIEKLEKNLRGRIEIGTTHPDGKAATISFDVVPEYSVAPPLIMVFNAEPEKSLMKEITVTNNYGKDFEIESVSSKKNTVAVEVVEKSRVHNGYQLKVEITVPSADGRIKFADELSVYLEDGKELPLKCNGYYRRNAPKS
jgi:hypothetical protein